MSTYDTKLDPAALAAAMDLCPPSFADDCRASLEEARVRQIARAMMAYRDEAVAAEREKVRQVVAVFEALVARKALPPNVLDLLAPLGAPPAALPAAPVVETMARDPDTDAMVVTRRAPKPAEPPADLVERVALVLCRARSKTASEQAIAAIAAMKGQP